MKGIAKAIVLMSMTTASAAEIRCQDAPGREQNGVFWSWREIEGKRCWFVRAGSAMPPKSAFTWAKEEPIQEDVPAVPDKHGEAGAVDEGQAGEVGDAAGPRLPPDVAEVGLQSR